MDYAASIADPGQCVAPLSAEQRGVEVAVTPTVRAAWRNLGQQLATRRKAAMLSQRDLAERTMFSRSSVANIEIGLQHINRAFWEKADEQVGAGGELVRGYDAAEALHRGQAWTSPRSGLDPIDDGLPDEGVDAVESPEDLVVIFGSLTEVADSRGWKAIQPLIARNISGFGRVLAGGRKSHGTLAFAESRWFEFMSWACDNGGSEEGGRWLNRAHASSIHANDNNLSSYILMRKSQKSSRQWRCA